MTASTTLIPQAEGSDFFEAPLQGGASWDFFLEHLQDEETVMALLDGLELLVVDIASPNGWEECAEEDWNALLLDWMGEKPPFKTPEAFWSALQTGLELELDFPDDDLPFYPVQEYRQLESIDIPVFLQDAFLHLYEKWCSTLFLELMDGMDVEGSYNPMEATLAILCLLSGFFRHKQTQHLYPID